MADVSGRDRGQLILVAALLLAALFVGLAIVVNGAIYAENFATRDTGGDTRDVLEQRSNVEYEVQRAVDRANAANITVSEADTRIRYSVDNLSDSLSRSGASFGKVVEVNVTSTTPGEQLQQRDPSRNFTAGGDNEGAADWKLAENTTEAGTFELDVNQAELLNASGDSADELLNDNETLLGAMLRHEAFHVEVTTANNDTWRVYLFQATETDPDNIYLYTEPPEEDILTVEMTLDVLLNESCAAPVTDGSATIDLRNARAGGEPCQDLEFYGDSVVGTEHDVDYRNARSTGIEQSDGEEIVDRFNETNRTDELESALETILGVDLTDGDPTADDVVNAWDDVGFSGDRATGEYELVVDTEHTSTTSANFYDLGAGEPSSRTVVFSAAVDMEYRSGEATLTTDGIEVRWSEAEP